VKYAVAPSCIDPTRVTLDGAGPPPVLTPTPFSPVLIRPDGSYTVVKDLPIDAFSRGKMDATGAELAEELALANELLK